MYVLLWKVMSSVLFFSLIWSSYETSLAMCDILNKVVFPRYRHGSFTQLVCHKKTSSGCKNIRLQF